MATNYEAIRVDNLEKYGTEIGRIGRILLADRYDRRSHFIFELVQNAEDALRRRGTWSGDRTVTFTLTETELVVSHFGTPFDRSDVLAVCGIADSKKGDASIGKFGIGFKSVYTFAERPEIHSGDEHFAIEKYVQPHAVPAIPLATDETKIVLKFNDGDAKAFDDIKHGLRTLGAKSLLFLTQVESISWSASDGTHGDYLRDRSQPMELDAHFVSLLGQEAGIPEVDERWLVFRREVAAGLDSSPRRVEIAFSVEGNLSDEQWRIVQVPQSFLVVYFETAVSTNLGFLIQGPYKTTPSRDNISIDEPWNKKLAEETAELLVEALRWLAARSKLDIEVLRCLPIDRNRFAGSVFLPLFESVKAALTSEPLIPSFTGGYISAKQARLGRTQDIKELFDGNQLTHLLRGGDLQWIGGDITRDRASDIRGYLNRDLGIVEVTPEIVVTGLTREFLQTQPDEWIPRLYRFLSSQAALRKRFEAQPLVRLENGSHVQALLAGAPQAFFPGPVDYEVPTVRANTCAPLDARAFLTTLGIMPPDPVDVVIRQVLPTYSSKSNSVSETAYATDIERLIKASRVDSSLLRAKLINALKSAHFVRATPTTGGAPVYMRPGDLSLSTARLRTLYAGVPRVHLVDDDVEALKGEEIRGLLDSCGTYRTPRLIEATQQPSVEELKALRTTAGQARTNFQSDTIVDWDIEGLEDLLALLPSLSRDDQASRGKAIWDSICELAERRGSTFLQASYSWSFHGAHSARFPARFLKVLNQSSWILDKDGQLCTPLSVAIEELGWDRNPLIETFVHFRPPVVDQLAEHLGFDPSIFAMLKALGVSSADQLKEVLQPAALLGAFSAAPTTSPLSHPLAPSEQESSAAEAGEPIVLGDALNVDGIEQLETRNEQPSNSGSERGSAGGHSAQSGGPSSPSSKPSKIEFVSFVSVSDREGARDPDGLEHSARMRLERRPPAFE